MKVFFFWSLSTFKKDWVLLAMISKCPYLHKTCIFLAPSCSAPGIQPALVSLSEHCSHCCNNDLLNWERGFTGLVESASSLVNTDGCEQSQRAPLRSPGCRVWSPGWGCANGELSLSQGGPSVGIKGDRFPACRV